MSKALRTSLRTWLIGVAIVVAGTFLVFAIQVGYAEWVFNRFPNHMSTRGQFGDIFGAVNAFFTGLAFAGVIVAICFQQRELGLQRQELALQREALESSTKELGRAAEAQTKQAELQTKQAKLSAVASELTFNLGVMVRLQEVLYEIADHKESFAYVWGAENSRPEENSRVQLSAHAVLDVVSMALAAANRLPGFSRNAAEDWQEYAKYVLTTCPNVLDEVLANPKWWPEITPFAEEVAHTKRGPKVSGATGGGAGKRSFSFKAVSWRSILRAVQRGTLHKH